MRVFELSKSQRLERPLPDVFAFFSNAENLECLTPPWLRFSIRTPRPIRMAEGTLIDYALRIHGIPIRWRSEITVWDPPHRFVDEQLRGPYRMWVHEHGFLADGDGTVVRDHVRYAVWGGSLVNRFLVAPDVRRIFAYREERLAERFGASSPVSSGA
jgi:ligand-binding SRPBCC domain-containing protein